MEHTKTPWAVFNATDIFPQWDDRGMNKICSTDIDSPLTGVFFGTPNGRADLEADPEAKTHIPFDEAKANARRIVACVNACEGIQTEMLELFGAEFWEKESKEIEQLQAQNERLLEALKYSLEAMESVASFGKTKPVIARIRATIAEAEKQLEK